MALEIKTIGTASRDHATHIAANASVTNGNFPTAGTTIRFDTFDDSVFTEEVDWNWVASNVDGVLNTSPVGERHLGTRGTGARIDGSIDISVKFMDVEFLEVFSAPITTAFGIRVSTDSSTTPANIRNMLVYEIENKNSNNFAGVREDLGAMRVSDTQIFDILQSGTGSRAARGIYGRSTSKDNEWFNVTIHDVTADSDTGKATCVDFKDEVQAKVKNCIATDPGGTSSGTKACYGISSPSTAEVNYNLSSDTTASGLGSLISITSVSLYVSATAGSEDLHLKTGAAALKAGLGPQSDADISTIDIDGTDLTGAAIRDMGADQKSVLEFVSIGADEFSAAVVLGRGHGIGGGIRRGIARGIG